MELPDDLCAWVEEATNGRVAEARRVMGGASREAWMVDVAGDDGALHELFLRRDNGTGPMQGTPYTIGREATVYRALASTPVPVPAVVAAHPDGNTVLLERIEGEAYFPAAGEAREQLAEQFVAILATLHTTDVRTLDLPALVTPCTPQEHATLELDIWEQLQRARGRPDPLVTFTLRWLRARVPTTVDRTVLVQGDTGPGNFMYRDGQIVAVVDWELAHLGDPMEDLAWVITRSLLQPFVPLGPWFRRYTELSGIAVDDARLHWWTVFNVVRCVIGEGVVTASGEANPERGMIYGLLQMHRRVTVDALAARRRYRRARDRVGRRRRERRREWRRRTDRAHAALRSRRRHHRRLVAARDRRPHGHAPGPRHGAARPPPRARRPVRPAGRRV